MDSHEKSKKMLQSLMREDSMERINSLWFSSWSEMDGESSEGEKNMSWQLDWQVRGEMNRKVADMDEAVEMNMEVHFKVEALLIKTNDQWCSQQMSTDYCHVSEAYRPFFISPSFLVKHWN